MSVETAQPVGMDPIEARERVDRVKAAVTQARADLVELWRQRAWLSLGYATWDDLCDAEFGVRLALPRDERRDAVAELRGEGMSTRAIGSALGVGKDTVHRDLSSVSDETDEPDRVQSLDGRQRPATRPPIDLAAARERAAEAERQRAAEQAENEEFWDDVAETAVQTGAAQRIADERPYGIAAVVIRRTTHELADLALRHPAADLAARIPEHARGGFDDIPTVTRYLTELLEALS